ncbi:uncharacterized protein BDV14DRAFT_198351 [Aspergillus stella-maris]|uniref:uncharacterized protein n=1 Tax=Aspergillus stella-maris TaxID=1810926 RepID=UPI003CCDC91E
MVLCGVPHDDGRELRRLDDFFTKHGFYRLARMGRKFDKIRTPKAEREIMTGFISLWEGVDQAIKDINALDAEDTPSAENDLPLPEPCRQLLIDRYRKTLESYSNTLTCYRRILDCYRSTLESYRVTRASYRKTLDCYDKTLDCYDKTLECYNKIMHCYDKSLDRYDRSSESQYRNELRLRVENLAQSAEKTRTEFSKMGVWQRAWVRPHLRDINQGLSRLLVQTTMQKRCSTCGHEINNQEAQEAKLLELNLPRTPAALTDSDSLSGLMYAKSET